MENLIITKEESMMNLAQDEASISVSKVMGYFVVFWMRNAPLQAHVFEHMASEGLEGMTLLEEVVTRTRFFPFPVCFPCSMFGVEDVIAQLPTPEVHCQPPPPL